MKPILFHNPKAIKESFYVQEDRVPHFYDILHYHPEFQLTVIIDGKGSAFVGDKIGRFNPGDVFLLGPNIPHVFRSDAEYYKPNSLVSSHSVSVYFNIDCFGDVFFNLPENFHVKHLLKNSKRGIRIGGPTSVTLMPQISSLFLSKGAPRIITFLNILNTLSIDKESKVLLSSPGFSTLDSHEDGDRMNLVLKYLMENFNKDIHLKTVAEIACMTTNAFCRFFKKKTRKTLTEFIIETRIGYACNLLINENKTVAQVAAHSGFKNNSNFNRQFKRVMNYTPSSYLEKYASKVMFTKEEV